MHLRGRYKQTFHSLKTPPKKVKYLYNKGCFYNRLQLLGLKTPLKQGVIVLTYFFG